MYTKEMQPDKENKAMYYILSALRVTIYDQL